VEDEEVAGGRGGRKRKRKRGKGGIKGGRVDLD